MAERRIVDPEDVGSSPIRSASFHDPVGEWLSHEAFNLVIAGSSPAGIATTRRPVAQQEERATDIREVGCASQPRSTILLGVAQPGQSSRPGSEMSQVQILPPRPNLRT